MSSEQTEATPEGIVRFTLKMQDCEIAVNAELPEGPVRPQALLPILQGLSDSLSDLTVRRAVQLGKQLSCREGCGACCRHAVPITPVEARMLSEWLNEQQEDRRAALRERFRHAAARLEESGIARDLREGGSTKERESIHALGLKYFSLGIACPFLEEERCTIHTIRPMRCREYLVVSPAEHCAYPESKEIVGIKPQVLLSRVLERWDPSGDPTAKEIILLTMLDEWVAQHPPALDIVRRTAPELLQEFLSGFASDPEPATGL